MTIANAWPTGRTCSRCGELGHTRRNWRHHPQLQPIGSTHDPKYGGTWRADRTLRRNFKGKCSACGKDAELGPGQLGKHGEPKGRCVECRDKANARNKRRRERLKRYTVALVAIASGTIDDAAAFALEAIRP